ncbi:MAG: hypothetical protein IJI47_01000 [Eubacterium sp.]|nr:hypothetical protein [Eubacterium sp.]
MANEPKKSKYFKSGDEKPTSKYRRAEGEQKKSKYIKTDSDRNAEKDKRANQYANKTSYRKNAASTNLSNRTAVSQSKAARSESKKADGSETKLRKDIKLPKEVTSIDEPIESKGNQASIFTNEKADRSAYKHYKEAEETPDENRRATQLVRNGLIIGGLLIVSIIINFIVLNQNGEIKYLPSFLSVEFSAIPEFIATLAFGPIVGVVIVLVKNVVHMILNQPSFVSEMSNFILDSLFIFFGGWLYTRRMFNFKPSHPQKMVKGKDYRTRRILFAGTVGTVITTIASFFTTRFLAYPLIIRVYGTRYGYSAVEILRTYQIALKNVRAAAPFIGWRIPDIGDSLTRAIIIYNVPITFAKFMFITVVVALLYPPISDFLHYRIKSKRSKKSSRSSHSSHSSQSSHSKHSNHSSHSKHHK